MIPTTQGLKFGIVEDTGKWAEPRPCENDEGTVGPYRNGTGRKEYGKTTLRDTKWVRAKVMMTKS
jgi:hypothetical protein